MTINYSFVPEGQSDRGGRVSADATACLPINHPQLQQLTLHPRHVRGSTLKREGELPLSLRLEKVEQVARLNCRRRAGGSQIIVCKHQ